MHHGEAWHGRGTVLILNPYLLQSRYGQILGAGRELIAAEDERDDVHVRLVRQGSRLPRRHRGLNAVEQTVNRVLAPAFHEAFAFHGPAEARQIVAVAAGARRQVGVAAAFRLGLAVNAVPNCPRRLFARLGERGRQRQRGEHSR